MLSSAVAAAVVEVVVITVAVEVVVCRTSGLHPLKIEAFQLSIAALIVVIEENGIVTSIVTETARTM